MSGGGRLGIELTPTALRAVRVASLSRRVTETFEVPWDPSRPADLVSALRAKGGRPDSIAVSIGLGFLEVARVDLPPVAPGEWARMIELEPDRYFAAANREPFAVTVASDAPIAFGVPASQLESWIAALETVAPVDWVEPSPVAIARLFTRGANAVHVVDVTEGEYGLLQLAGGRLTSVRRTSDQNAIRDARPVPSLGGTSGTFAAAMGVLGRRSSGARSAPALAPEQRRRRFVMRERVAMATSAVLAVAAVVFALWSADRWRERTLADLEDRIAQAELRGAGADSTLRRLRSRQQEAAAIRDLSASRADPFGALAVISATLPREANVLSARATGNDWQVDGTTIDASVLVPLLDRHAQFDSVRFLSASSRYRDANRSYETFSIAFRFRP